MVALQFKKNQILISDLCLGLFSRNSFVIEIQWQTSYNPSIYLPVACNYRQELSTTQKLHLTAKVLEFLKDYHPKVNEGKINWDDQLVDIIQKQNDVKTNQKLSELFLFSKMAHNLCVYYRKCFRYFTLL